MTTNNGKWQLAFWIMSGVCITGMLGLTTGVVANQRINIKTHADIRREAKEDKEDIMKELQKIVGKLGNIEGKLERLD